VADMKNKKADIRQKIIDGVCYVYVLDKRGKECFIMEKSKQTIAIAHAIYMFEKYNNQSEMIALHFIPAALHTPPNLPYTLENRQRG
jgi:hypothetical protein